MTATQLLTVPEAARRLGVSERTIWRWIRSGAVATERAGRSVLVGVDQSSASGSHRAGEATAPYGGVRRAASGRSGVVGAPDTWPWSLEVAGRGAARVTARRRAAVAAMERLGERSRPDPDGLTVVDYLRELRDPDWSGES